jgi:hypothetical protein
MLFHDNFNMRPVCALHHVELILQSTLVHESVYSYGFNVCVSCLVSVGGFTPPFVPTVNPSPSGVGAACFIWQFAWSTYDRVS